MGLGHWAREGERDRKCSRQAAKPQTIVCYNAVLCQTNYYTPSPCFQLIFHFFPAIPVSYPLLRPHLSDSTNGLIHFANRLHFTKHADAFQGPYFAFKFYPTDSPCKLVQTKLRACLRLYVYFWSDTQVGMRQRSREGQGIGRSRRGRGQPKGRGQFTFRRRN